MAFSSWRGTVGIVRPTLRTGGFEDLVRMLPEGIGVIPLILNVRRGAVDEFKTVIPAYEEKVAELAAAGCDVINPSGAPPFMVLGYDKEQALIRDLAGQIQHPHLHLRHQPCRCVARAQGPPLHRRHLFSRRHQSHLCATISTTPASSALPWPAWMSISTRRRSFRASRSTASSSANSWRSARAEAIYMLGPGLAHPRYRRDA